MEVLRQNACGFSYGEIAKQYGVSYDCVRQQLNSAYAKLGVENGTQAALYAWRNGIVSVDEAWARLEATLPPPTTPRPRLTTKDSPLVTITICREDAYRLPAYVLMNALRYRMGSKSGVAP